MEDFNREIVTYFKITPEDLGLNKTHPANKSTGKTFVSYFKLTQNDCGEKPRENAYESQYEPTNRQPEYYGTDSEDDYDKEPRENAYESKYEQINRQPEYYYTDSDDDKHPKKNKPWIAIVAILVVVIAVSIIAPLIINSTTTQNSAATRQTSAAVEDDTAEISGSTSSDTSAASTEIVNSIVDTAYFGGEGTSDNPITLKVWAPDKAVSLVKEQVEAFKAAYPDINFGEITVVAQGEVNAATQILNDATTAADVFSFASDSLNDLVDAGVISTVSPAFTEYVKEQNIGLTVTSATVDGSIYAYPETNDNGYFLIYDKSVVTDEDAKTFEGVLEACKNAGKKFIMDAGNGYYACTFAFTGGVKVDGLEDDGITQKFTTYDEDEAVATLQAFAQLFQDYKGTFQSLSASSVLSGFSNGTAGAGIDGSWDTADMQEALGENFGAAKLPTINVNGTDKQLISMFGYKYLGVNGSSQFPNASQILALYLSGETCQNQRATELGWGPSNKNVASSDLVKNSASLTAIAEQSQNSCAQVNIASTFWTPMANLGNKLVADDCDPTDTATMKKLLEDTIANIRVE